MNYLEAAFHKFDHENPRVWELFIRFAGEARMAGHRRFGAASIIERIRWETSVVTQGDRFKINDHHAAYYARKLVATDPTYSGFFSFRMIKSEVAI